jgi:hypothetical protein
MRNSGRPGAIVALAAVLALIIAGCTGDAEETTTTIAAPTTTAPVTTTTTPEPEEPEIEIPNLASWEGSGHADAAAEAFRHWDEDEPPMIPADCARCHSDTGYRDYIGADGTAAGTVEADQATGTVVTCTTCHNAATAVMDSVVMPSGVEITGLGAEARCMQCHQGRQSKVSVDAAIEGLDLDTVSADLGFKNIHYFAAAATKYGTIAQGGYEYEGKAYDGVFQHVPGYTTCVECHDSHTLELKMEECAGCHTGVATAEDARNIRMPGSAVDYDGDGNTQEGIYYEIEGVRAYLYQAIQSYAAEVAGAPIVYDPSANPYFFGDANANGAVDEGEEGYAAWTPRLLKAAYNYQVSIKDPGAYAHGGKYIIQLLVDSTEDLNSVLSTPVAIDAVHRIDFGHFAGSEEAFRHWDGDGGIVPRTCSRCHSAGGLPQFLQEGVTISQPAANGFLCTTCHSDLATWTRYEVGAVAFPSGATADTGNPDSNLCINCHQGRESTTSVNALIGDAPDDVASEWLRFLNVHYFAAGATLFGTEVKGAYEYAGQTYLGRRVHVEAFDTCTECHGAHTLEVQVAACGGCHAGVATLEDLEGIRVSTTDYDGDGDTAEGIAGEIDTMREALIAGMQAYAAATEGATAIVYDPNAYPYFFADANANGAVDEDEEGYGSWTPRLLRAAYNLQYAGKDPGGFAHNPLYIIQVLYDSLADIGHDVSGMTRP